MDKSHKYSFERWICQEVVTTSRQLQDSKPESGEEPATYIWRQTSVIVSPTSPKRAPVAGRSL